jgi:hypothetical protein
MPAIAAQAVNPDLPRSDRTAQVAVCMGKLAVAVGDIRTTHKRIARLELPRVCARSTSIMVMAVYILALAAQLVPCPQIVRAIRACSLVSTRRALARHNTADRGRWPRGSIIMPT